MTQKRYWLIILLTAIVMTIGCKSVVPLPTVINDSPSLTEIEQAVNANSSKIQTLYAPNATLGAGNIPGWANCQMAYTRPGNIRVIGTANMMGRVIDTGSNNDVFWFWNKFQEPQQISWCRMSELQNPSVAQALPINPVWFPEAMGVVEFKQGETTEGPIPQPDKTLLLISKRNLNGALYTKYTYIEPKTAAVKRQDIMDATGTILASVQCNEFQYDNITGVVLPKKMVISSPKYNESFHLDLGKVTINGNDTNAQTFQMPKGEDLGNGNVPLVNIAQTGSAIPTTSGKTTITAPVPSTVPPVTAVPAAVPSTASTVAANTTIRAASPARGNSGPPFPHASPAGTSSKTILPPLLVKPVTPPVATAPGPVTVPTANSSPPVVTSNPTPVTPPTQVQAPRNAPVTPPATAQAPRNAPVVPPANTPPVTAGQSIPVPVSNGPTKAPSTSLDSAASGTATTAHFRTQVIP